jgi:hypothetical protein
MENNIKNSISVELSRMSKRIFEEGNVKENWSSIIIALKNNLNLTYFQI